MGKANAPGSCHRPCICHPSLSASCFQAQWEHNIGRTEGFVQTRNAKGKPQICSPISTHWQLCKQPTTKKSALPSASEIPLPSHSPSAPAVLLLTPQVCGKVSSARLMATLTFSSLKCEDITWGGRHKKFPVSPRHQCVCLLNSPEGERKNTLCMSS